MLFMGFLPGAERLAARMAADIFYFSNIITAGAPETRRAGTKERMGA
jgi:hypothetical protein